jgi:flagellar hook-associated protein 2
MSMSVDGLISGMDTTALITQLLQAEAGPQTALKSRLSATQTAASAYRTVNTTFAAIRAAAEGMLKADAWTPVKVTTSSTSVAASASTGATPGSLTFSVEKLAAAHAVVNRNAGSWTSATAAYGSTSVEIFDKAGVSKGPAISLAPGATLADAAAAINSSSYGLTAGVVEISPTEFALQLTSKTTGAASEFSVTGAGTFGVTMQAQSAELKIGTGPAAYSVTSATNTFASVMPGASLTVSSAAPGVGVSVTVASNPDAVATQVQTLVDAVNSALSTVKTYTNNSKGSTAALKGDYAVTQLSGRLLDAVSFAIGSDGSPAKVGFELTKDGKITFDKATFLSALKDDPTVAQRMVAGTAAGAGTDGVAGTADDIAASGIAGRLLSAAKAASDTATGSLVKLAEGQDSMAKDITDRIEAWDLRLAKRKEMLTRQFSAMETALSSLKNQSTWLAGQINSLPSYG